MQMLQMYEDGTHMYSRNDWNDESWVRWDAMGSGSDGCRKVLHVLHLTALPGAARDQDVVQEASLSFSWHAAVYFAEPKEPNTP